MELLHGKFSRPVLLQHQEACQALLYAAGLGNDQIYPDSATIIFELYKDSTNGQHSVMIHLKNDTSPDAGLHTLEISGCPEETENFCDFDRFLSLMKDKTFDTVEERRSACSEKNNGANSGLFGGPIPLIAMLLAPLLLSQ